jgi:hypothetical protein
MGLAKGVCTAASAILLLCSDPAFAGPTFESVTFGKHSTHCDTKNASVSIKHEGRGIIVGFDKMLIEVGSKASGTEHMRCDVTLKLAAPLDAPAVIQIDVRGDSLLTGKGTTAATFTMLGRKEEINFHPIDDAGVQRFSAKLPKGARQLDFTIEASAQGSYPDSTALIFIGSLDIGFEWRK